MKTIRLLGQTPPGLESQVFAPGLVAVEGMLCVGICSANFSQPQNFYSKVLVFCLLDAGVIVGFAAAQ